MNPHLQYFISLTEYRQTASFYPSIMSRFRQRLTAKILRDVNNVMTRRKKAEIIEDACAPQAIRFPTDTSLLSEAQQNIEGIIDSLHAAGLMDGKKPRTYRIVIKKQYNGFSKSPKTTSRSIRNAKRQQLNFLRRNLKHIDNMIQNHPDEWEKALSKWQRERLAVIHTLYAQQRGTYELGSARIDDRIVSLSQPWVHPIVRGRQNAPME